MLYTVQSARRETPDHVLRAMFAARKAVFVDLLKWDVPVIDGRYEIDQFDDEHAHYLILADDNGGHLGSARLLPTSRAHILGTLYPELCDDTPPSGPAIFEITRFCLDRTLRAIERRAVRDTLVASLARYALDHDIARYTAIADMGWLQQILAFGWRCMPLGLPHLSDGRLLGALEITITPDTPALLAAAGIRARDAILAHRRLAAA